MSLLSSSLARHGRRRLRPTLAVHPPPPFFASSVDNNNDDDGNQKHHNLVHIQNQRNISLLSRHYRGAHDDCLPIHQHHNDARPEPAATAYHVPTRQYHTTAKREILPLLAVGFLGASAVYTYRTFQQMDQDWEDYYDELEEYKAVTGIDPEKQDLGDATTTASSNASAASNNSEDLSSFFTGGTLAIDMGTSRLKLSHRSSLANKSQYKNGKPPSPIVSVDREGFRSTPSLVWVPPTAEEDMLIGRLAESRVYDSKGGSIVHIGYSTEDGTMNEDAVQRAIRAVASNALDQVLGGSNSSLGQNGNPLFVLDASMSMRGSYNVRPIFTHPPNYEHLDLYQHAVNSLTSPGGIAAFVPEPVAVISGAEYYNLLPPKNTSTGSSVLIIDVGGASTNVSMVGDNNAEILHSAQLPIGGDTFIDVLVSHLAKGFFDQHGNSDDPTETPASLSSKPSLNDPTALQRLYEAATTAIHELSNKTRSEINIPYLTMDLQTRQPKHLEVGMARNVVDAEVETWIRTKLVPYLQTKVGDNLSPTALSQALPPPTNLSTLFSSAIMSALEQTSHTPHMLRAVLLVGGGARIPLVKNAIREGVGYLAGDAYASGGEGNRLIIPEGEMGEELGVLGAAVWGSDGRR